MSAATINLSAVIDTMGGTANTPVKFTAQVMRGGAPAIRVAGPVATVPAPLTAYWSGTAWKAAAPALTDVPDGCRWAVRLEKTDRSAVLERDVLLPTPHASTVDFGDLLDVDPDTLAPYSPAPSLQALLAQAAATLAAVQAAAGQMALDGGTATSTYENTTDIDGGAAA